MMPSFHLVDPPDSAGSLDVVKFFMYVVTAWASLFFIVIVLAYLRIFFLTYQLYRAIKRKMELFVTLPSPQTGKMRVLTLSTALDELLEADRRLLRQNTTVGGKFESSLRALVTGRPVEAALGVHDFLRAPDKEIYMGLAEGIGAIVREVKARGTEEDKMCLEYVLHATTGSNTTKFPNGVLDEGRPKGLRFRSFVEHPMSQKAKLSEAHVLALRLYTTAAYKSLNGPLRDRERVDAHPLAVTIAFINEGIKKLRAVHADTEDGQKPMDLWRGMRDLKVTEDFLREGGTEYAPMSTTSDLEVAVRYSSSANPLIFKVKTTSFMERGADLQFLSAFPGEAELAFGPLTYLKPTGQVQELSAGGRHFTVVEVVPSFAS